MSDCTALIKIWGKTAFDSRVASAEGTIIFTRTGVTLQSIPSDPERQVYDVYMITGGSKAVAVGKAVVEEHADAIRKMEVYDAYKFVDAEITKRAKVKAKWHSYSMPD